MDEKLHAFGYPSWRLSLILLASWIIVILAVTRGTRASGKVKKKNNKKNPLTEFVDSWIVTSSELQRVCLSVCLLISVLSPADR